MALLTHNRIDFEALHRRSLEKGLNHWGILVAARRRPAITVEHVVRLLDRLTADEIKNQLFYV